MASCISHSIRLQDSPSINVCGKNQLIPESFCMEITIKRRKDLRLPLLVGCDQLCLSSSQIVEFFDHQCTWKKSIDTLFFYMEIAITRRKDLRQPLLVVCGQLCVLSNHTAGFFDHQYLWKASIRRFLKNKNFCMEVTIRRNEDLKLPLLIWCGQLHHFSNQVLPSLDG